VPEPVHPRWVAGTENHGLTSVILQDRNRPLRPTGSLCAIVTPFDDSGAVDLPAFGALVDWHRASGTEGLIVGGSTGESGALDEHEFEALLDIALVRAGAMMVIAGCGAPATHKAIRLGQTARRAGAAGLLAVTPYYSRPTQQGLLAHYGALVEALDLPVILYNVPTRTGCDLLPETAAMLARDPRIVGIKEARPEPERMAALLALKTPGFAVLSGDDPTACRAMQAGADGTISVAANIVPRAFRALCDAARGNSTYAATLDSTLQPLFQFLGFESNPIPIKWLLQRAGRIRGGLRSPLLPLSASAMSAGEAEWSRLQTAGIE
jgi:4-hydroxy-tetrahydrodipicolinate synthase